LEKTVLYRGEYISVSYEVAEFLESDRKRHQAERRRDRRRLSKSNFETELESQKNVYRHGLEDEVIKTLTLENLYEMIAALTDEEQRLLHLYYWEEMSMEAIGKVFGVSKMAISKRLKKLYATMRSPVDDTGLLFFVFFLW